LPIARFGCGLNDVDQSRVAQMAQSVFEWIRFDFRGDLVDE